MVGSALPPLTDGSPEAGGEKENTNEKEVVYGMGWNEGGE